ncbi:MAG TPA: hypothetical protein VF607_07585 [Verrucomicrobiae bacterium]
MKQAESVYATERTFLRSCLESVPTGSLLRQFQLRGAAAARGPATLVQLKQNLLQAALAVTQYPEARRQLCGAANAAADLAWESDLPMLVFPCLFEERARQIQNRFAFEEMVTAADALADSAQTESSIPASATEMFNRLNPFHSGLSEMTV